MAAYAGSGTRKRNVEPEALELLKGIPGVPSKNALRKWLYRAQMVSPSDREYRVILEYVRNSQEHGFGIRVLNVVRITRKNSFEFGQYGNQIKKLRMMLWHGTNVNCVAKILQSGIQQPSLNWGQMFGTGIYFADRASKSAQYCASSTQVGAPATNTVGYLFLCDVIVGEMFNAKQPKNNATSPPSYRKRNGQVVQCDSVKCTGEWVPDRLEQEEIDGVVWPVGETIQNKKFDSYTVQYNEFAVYNPNNVKPKYLVKVRFEARLVH